MSPIWYNTKERLLQDTKASTEIYIISEDTHSTGQKRYTYFKNGEDLIRYIQSKQNPHCHEIIYDVKNFPCYLYFDIDNKVTYQVTSALHQKMVERFEVIFTAFIKDIYNHDISLHLGKNWQVAYTPSTNKLSLHVK